MSCVHGGKHNVEAATYQPGRSPLVEVLDARAFWVTRDPQFEIFIPIIVALAVFVMDSFKRLQLAAESLLHHLAMLEGLFMPTRRAAVPILVQVVGTLRFMLALFAAVSADIESHRTPSPKESASLKSSFALLTYEGRQDFASKCHVTHPMFGTGDGSGGYVGGQV
jgi:hypothetical protein